MSIKTDNTATLVNALAEIERLQGRVSELEWQIDRPRTALLKERSELKARVSELEAEVEFISGIGSHLTRASTLRKQAEAVEEASYSCQMSTDEGETVCGTWVLGKYASDLRQQADELENNNAQEH